MKMPRSIVAMLALLIGLVGLSPLAAADKSMPNLSGVWMLNAEMSDDPRSVMKEMMERGRGAQRGAENVGPGGPSNRGGGVRLPGTFSGASGVGGGGFQGAGGSGGVMGLVTLMSQGIDLLTIEHEDPAFRMVNSMGAGTLLFTDGRTIEIEEEDGGKIKTRTRWKKNRVVMQVTFPSKDGLRRSIMQSFELKGSVLVVTTTVAATSPSRPSKPVTLRRVYNRENS